MSETTINESTVFPETRSRCPFGLDHPGLDKAQLRSTKCPFAMAKLKAHTESNFNLSNVSFTSLISETSTPTASPVISLSFREKHQAWLNAEIEREKHQASLNAEIGREKPIVWLNSETDLLTPNKFYDSKRSTDRLAPLPHVSSAPHASAALPTLQRNQSSAQSSASSVVERRHLLRFMKPLKYELNQVVYNQHVMETNIDTLNNVALILLAIASFVGIIVAMCFAYALNTGVIDCSKIRLLQLVFSLCDFFGKWWFLPGLISFAFVKFHCACYILTVSSVLVFSLSNSHISIPIAIVYYGSHYNTWKNNFAHRYKRTDKKCYSNGSRPTIQEAQLSNNASGHGANRSEPTNFRLKTYRKANETSTKCKHVNKEKMLHDMDHIYISLGWYMWLATFVTPNSVALAFFGNLYWRLREVAIKYGIIQGKIKDTNRISADLTLQTSQARNYQGKHYNDDGDEIAIFILENFLVPSEDDKNMIVDRLEWHINLSTKSVCYNKLTSRMSESEEQKEETIGAGDLLCLLYAQNVSSNHVQSHTFANWGLDHESHDAFIRRMSNITSVYNYFGRTVFIDVTYFLKWIGLSHFAFPTFPETVQQGLDCPIVNHNIIRQLNDHSDWIRFITTLRNPFMNMFNQRARKGEMGIVDGEALFVGTIVHSLDHLGLERSIDETSWFQCNTSRFERCQWLSRIVRGGFVDDIPGIMFNFHYKDAPEGFFRDVYKHAITISKDYANEIQCCILK